VHTTATLTPQPIDGSVVQGAVRRLIWTTYRGQRASARKVLVSRKRSTRRL